MNASSREAWIGVSSYKHKAFGRGGLSDLLRGQAGDLKRAPLAALHRHVGAEHQVSQLRSLGRTHMHELLGGAAHELLDARVGDQTAPADDDEMLGGEGHLAHEVGGDKDGPPLAWPDP